MSVSSKEVNLEEEDLAATSRHQRGGLGIKWSSVSDPSICSPGTVIGSHGANVFAKYWVWRTSFDAGGKVAWPARAGHSTADGPGSSSLLVPLQEGVHEWLWQSLHVPEPVLCHKRMARGKAGF